ncbi:MAG: hypothetical protein ACT4N5_06170 [Nitrosopumilaceae archaeon]
MKQTSLVAAGLAILIIFSFTLPAYSEVTSLRTNKALYIKNQDTSMTFTGTAGEENISDMATVVIYDPGGNFVKAFSGSVGADRTFEIRISGKDFTKISSHGTYNATGFIVQKKDGVSVTFDYSIDGNPIHPTQTTPTPTQTSTQPTQTTSSSQTSSSSQSSSSSSDDGKKSIQEKIQERIEAAKQQSQTTDDSDSEKSIEEKIKERIEAAKNPQTGTADPEQEAPTDDTAKPEEKPEETKKPDSTNNPYIDSNIMYIAIGVGAAAAVGVAMYGMKLKPKFLAREVSDTSSTNQQTTSSEEEDYSLMILKNRLAKGEISVEEFNELKRALSG